MKLKKLFKTTVCLAFIICMALFLSACDNKPEIRNYTYDDRVMAAANAKTVHTAVTAALARIYQSGGEINDEIISISNFNPETLEKTGKGGKGGVDKIYDDEGNVIELDLASILGDNFTGYFIAEVYIDNEDNECYVESAEWIEPNTFALLSQNKGSYGLPEGVTEDNLLIGSFSY